jgi:endo-1,4-beta-xylanase
MTIKFTARTGRLFSIALTIIAAAWCANPAHAQMATGKAKFVGNVVGSSVPSNFSTYWNQITPENATKWGSVEGTQNVMNWAQADTAYNYAQSHGYKFKFHTLVWGSQFPGWLTGLTQTQQRAEIEQWISLAGQHFPNAWAVDVVNEPTKTPLPWKAALGGDGATGWDWVITSYQLARTAFPNAKLFINEYGTENDPNARNQYKTIINLLKARGLIDGIGIQSHYFNIDSMTGSAVTAMLNDYATLGLDLYVSEMDIIGNSTDAGQLAKYQDVFPAFWNHASVKGFTLWGYIVGQTWRDGTGLVTTAGVERPALTWLKGFVSGQTGPGTDTQAPSTPANLAAPSTTSSSISLTWTASTDNVGVTGYQVLRASGASGGTFAQIGASTTNSFANSGLAAGTTFRYQVRATDAAGNVSAVSNTVTAATQAGGGDSQAPSTPANLTAPSTTSSSISLAWTASTDNVGVTGYQVLRAPGTSGGTFAQVGTATSSSFANTGLTAGTTFRYQVRATDAAGNVSAVSNTVTASTQTGSPAGGCTAVATVQTQWQDGYVIEPVRVTNSGTATISSWTVTFTLPAGHTVTGNWNSVVTTSGQNVTVRNAPHNGTVSAGGNTTFGFQVSRPNGNTQLPSGYTCASP